MLDTSVLIGSGKQALTTYRDATVIIPLPVIVELEKLKNDPLIGFMARSALRQIEQMDTHKLHKGIILDNNSKVKIEINHIQNLDTLPESVRRRGGTDILIMAVARNFANEHKNSKVTLVSNDLSMRILAATALDLHTMPHAGTSPQGAYTGTAELIVSEEHIDAIYKGETLNINDLPTGQTLTGAHGGAILKTVSNKSAIVKYNHRGEISRSRELKAYGISPRSWKQQIALEHLFNPDIPLVSLGGRAGTGKTLLALAAATHKTVEENTYDKIMVFRPLSPVGNEQLGFLPGTEEEKMSPWGQAISDVMTRIGENTYQELLANETIEVLPVSHIRGRTFHNSFVLIDEAQNLERGTLLSLISRAGEGSKIVLSWDAAQRDNFHIGQHDGIVSLVDILKDKELFAHINLTKSERSPLAELASDILEQNYP